MPRQLLFRFFGLAVASSLLVGFAAAPVSAKQDPEVKKVKRELVAVQSRIDEQRSALDRLGRRWDQLEARGARGANDLGGFVANAFGVAEQVHIETLIVQVREALDRFEAQQEDAITELERIVVARQEKKLEKSGVAAATIPSISVGGSLVTYSGDWEKTAMCESTKRWHIDSRYDGGLQFDPITWIEFGGAEFARYAYEASKLEQIAVAERVLAIQGPGAWPNCFTPLQADT